MMELICIIGSAVITGLLCYFCGWYESVGGIVGTAFAFVGFYIAVMALVFVIAFFLSAIVDISKPVKKPSKFYTFVYHLFLSFLIRLFRVKLIVEGEENLPEGNALFVSNHRSILDPMLLANKYKSRRILMISKPQNFRIPIAGGTIHKAGYMSVDRENDKEALKTIIRAIKYEKEGYSVGVCPEGTRNKTSVNLMEFRHGSLKVATKANKPIVVCVFHNTQKVMKNLPFKRTKVYLHILKTIYPEEYQGKTTLEISDYCHEIMQRDIDAFESANH